jgi:hypothetical protein
MSGLSAKSLSTNELPLVDRVKPWASRNTTCENDSLGCDRSPRNASYASKSSVIVLCAMYAI